MLLDLNATLDSEAAHVFFAVLGATLLGVLGRELRHVPAKLLVLMATAFLDMVGLFMVVPLLPFYVKRFVPDGLALGGMTLAVGTVTGLVVSAFTLAQLLSAPFWGRCSDRYGRRPVLMVALGASSVAFLLFGYADSLWLLALSRVVQGAGGGTVGVVQAYVTDAVEPAQRARALGWLSAATNLGVAFGPWLGSRAVTLGEADLWPGAADVRLGHAAPGVLAALLCALNVLFAWRYLREPGQRQPGNKPRTTVREAIVRVIGSPRLPSSRLILVYAVTIGASQGVHPLFAPLLDQRFGVDAEHIGNLFMYIGSIAVFARVVLLGRMVDRFGEARTAGTGMIVLVAAQIGVALASGLWSLAAVFALLPIGMALTFPCVTAMLSHHVADHERGTVMGMQQTFGGFARLTAPPLYGWLFDNLGAPQPFFVAAGFVAATLLFGFRGASARPADHS